MANINDPILKKILLNSKNNKLQRTSDAELFRYKSPMKFIEPSGLQQQEFYSGSEDDLVEQPLFDLVKQEENINPSVAETIAGRDELHPAFNRLWHKQSSGGMNNFHLNTENSTQNSDVVDDDVFDDILRHNKKYQNQNNLLYGARTASNLGMLINNIMQPEGDRLPSQINLTRPDIQYDDTLRRRMVSEAGKQSNVAQMNAMKMGMGSAIPAINASMLSATNDANTQAQASINEIQQKNAIMAADIANKEVESNLMLKEKIIQDALMKNELRNKAISGTTDTLFKEAGQWMNNNAAFGEEEVMTSILRKKAANPDNVLYDQLISTFGKQSNNTTTRRKKDDDEIEIEGVKYKKQGTNGYNR